MGGFAARSPAQRQLHRIARLLFGRGMRRALIKDHHNVAAEIALHLHGGLGIDKHWTAVNRRLELHTRFTDFAHIAQTEHLKTARVGKNRPLPLNKVV